MNPADQSSEKITVSAPETRTQSRLQNYYVLVTTKSAQIAPPVILFALVLAPNYSKWDVPYLYLASGLILAAAIGLVLMSLDIRGALDRRPFIPGVLFRGPFEQTPESSWKRPKELDELSTLIESTYGKAIVVFGPSGVGKSHLLSIDVCQTFEEKGWIPIKVDAYSCIDTELPKELQKRFSPYSNISTVDNAWKADHDLLLILDQFEQFIDNSTSREHDWLKNFCVSSLKSPKFHLVIAVRQDWSRPCQRLLKEWKVKPVEYDLLGVHPGDEDITYNDLKTDMRDACRDIETAQKALSDLTIGKGRQHGREEILPVAAQIVGLGLENLGSMKNRTVTPEDYDKLGGKEGIIKLFFDRLINASPNRDISRAVLFALSVHNALHVAPKLTDLTAVTHHHPGRIRKCVEYFSGHGLIKQRPDGFMELTHDYIAEELRELTGRSLSSGERDNIAYFSEHHDFSRKSEKPSVPDERTALLTFGAVLWLLVAGVHSVRLFGPLVGLRLDWVLPWPERLSEWLSLPIDLYNALIWASTIAMATYILFLYGRVFVNLKEPTFGKIFSVAVIIIIAFGGAFFIPLAPETWGIVISISGVLIGLKFLQLSYFARYAEVAKNFFRQEAIKTIYLCLFLAVLGATFIWYVKTTPISDEMLFGSNFVINVGSILILICAWRAWKNHITWSSTAEILGKFDRGRSHKAET